MANSGFNIAPAALADIIVADLRPKLPVLDVFTTMAQSTEDRGITIDVPFVAGDDAITFDKASGGYHQTGNADVTKSSVRCNFFGFRESIKSFFFPKKMLVRKLIRFYFFGILSEM